LSVRLAPLSFAALSRTLCCVTAALTLLSFPGETSLGAEAGNSEENHAAVLKLAAEIAGQGGGNPAAHKSALITDYENVYGSTSQVPAHWPALVRRALVCREVGDLLCVQSSIDAIEQQGGVDTLPLSHLMEVSRFKMSVETIHTALQAPHPTAGDSHTPSRKAVAPVVAAAPADVGAGASTSAHASGKAASKPAAKPVAAKTASVKPPPRTFVQKATARLKQLGIDDQSVFFLDALFISVAISLVLAYFLFAATRSRKTLLTDASAAQQIQKLENLLAAEKLRTEEAVSLEKTNSEMVLEAQKVQAEHLLKEAQLAMQEAIKAEKAGAEQLLRNERERVTEVIEAANKRAEQAIDTGVQAAVAELEKSLRQIEILRQALQVEKEQRAVIDARSGDASRAVEAMRVTEVRLRDELRSSQAAHGPEVRRLTEKLHAAQRAAISLHALLMAARARNAELESQAAQAAQAGPVTEGRGAEVRSLHATRPEATPPATKSA